MAEFLMKPKIDFAFKEIMMDENARIGFLSAVLKLNPAEIRETKILNTFLRKEHEDDKQGILDVRVLLNNDMEIDIEIQLSELRVWADRSLFYLSQMYTEQIKSGDPYDVFKKCVSISILDFDLFHDQAEFYSCFHIREDTRSFLYTDKMEFHVIELPKLPQELKDDKDDILLWAKFISSERKEEFEMLAEKNTYIQSAYKTLQVISQDDQKRMEYKAREKAIRDYNQGMLEAEQRGEERGWSAGERAGMEKGRKEGREEGRKEGREEGRKEGREEGRKEGREEGQLEGKKSTAKNMLAIGLPIDIIIQSTGLSREKIDQLSKGGQTS